MMHKAVALLASFTIGAGVAGLVALSGSEFVQGTPHAAPQATASAHDPYSPITGANLDREDAAAAILDRMDSGLPMFEDWTWEGMPAVVGEYNDDLLDEYQASVDGDVEMFLIYAERGIHPQPAA